MLIELPVFWIVVLNVAGWPAVQLGLAWAFTCMPAGWFNPGPAYGWEKGGWFYERILATKRWKDWMPDAARWFSGGFAKGKLNTKNPEYLARFIRETWRGELCHWLAIGCGPIFFLWNPWWGDLIIIAYCLTANLPCIIVQRYNRIRLVRLLAVRISHNSSPNAP